MESSKLILDQPNICTESMISLNKVSRNQRQRLSTWIKNEPWLFKKGSVPIRMSPEKKSSLVFFARASSQNESFADLLSNAPLMKLKTKRYSNFKSKLRIPLQRKKTSKIMENLKKYTVVPTENMQEKIDYFFSPYNRKLNFSKFMKFEEEQSWIELTDFILKEDKDIFRKSLNSINNGLYLELENVAKNRIKKAKIKNKKE